MIFEYDCREIPKECGYCKNKPIKLIEIVIKHYIRADYISRSFVCKDHINQAELDAIKEG